MSRTPTPQPDERKSGIPVQLAVLIAIMTLGLLGLAGKLFGFF